MNSLITVDDIVKVVSKHVGCDPDKLMKIKYIRDKEYIYAKQLVLYFVLKFEVMSLTDAGTFIWKNRSSLYSALNTVKNYIETSKIRNRQILDITESLTTISIIKTKVAKLEYEYEAIVESNGTLFEIMKKTVDLLDLMRKTQTDLNEQLKVASNNITYYKHKSLIV